VTLFSQRKGIRPVAKAIQRESIDDDLRNRLWSALKIDLWDHWSPRDKHYGFQDQGGKGVEVVVKLIWLHYFKQPVDTIPAFDRDIPRSAYDIIRECFFKGQWWESYDLIEFVIKNIPEEWKERLKERLNSFMSSENAAYRIVGDEIVEITDEQEIETIETAMDKGLKACRSHLTRAIELVSDRKQPDFRNSIKESISAVEAACKVFASMPKATLGDCIKVIKSNGTIHPAFEKALLSLYGYTSDEGGIRHALTDESVTPAYSDAKFMLVASSAFVNFLLTKAAELGIKIDQ
jgi:hypothetical protein